MNENAALARLQVLATRQRLSLGVIHSANPDDFALMMAAAGCAFADGDTRSEREVNERLRDWLGGPGTMLAVDHVALRRRLVDTGVLARDGFGRAYISGTPRTDIASAMEARAGLDLATLVADAQTRDAARRDARKAQRAKADEDLV